MADVGLSENLRQLVNRHLPTMDHVALLLALRDQPGTSQPPAALAESARIDLGVAVRVLDELVAAHLARGDANGFSYAPALNVGPLVDELAEMNRTRPVTLVRAVYDRPSRAAQSFADAFRLRKTEE